MPKPPYPFRPRSTSSLRAGQFWAIRLSDGRFGCGRVIQVGGDMLPTPNRSFFGGLHDWVSDVPPTADSIASSAFLAWGVMHIRAITETGGDILGLRELAADNVKPPTLASAVGGPGMTVLEGARSIRPASREEWGQFPVLGYWGYDFIRSLAEQHLLGVS